jgi:hypothetical protein
VIKGTNTFCGFYRGITSTYYSIKIITACKIANCGDDEYKIIKNVSGFGDGIPGIAEKPFKRFRELLCPRPHPPPRPNISTVFYY